MKKSNEQTFPWLGKLVLCQVTFMFSCAIYNFALASLSFHSVPKDHLGMQEPLAIFSFCFWHIVPHPCVAFQISHPIYQLVQAILVEVSLPPALHLGFGYLVCPNCPLFSQLTVTHSGICWCSVGMPSALPASHLDRSNNGKCLPSEPQEAPHRSEQMSSSFRTGPTLLPLGSGVHTKDVGFWLKTITDLRTEGLGAWAS